MVAITSSAIIIIHSLVRAPYPMGVPRPVTKLLVAPVLLQVSVVVAGPHFVCDAIEALEKAVTRLYLQGVSADPISRNIYPFFGEKSKS